MNRSFRKVPAAVVQTACRLYILNRKEHIKAVREEAIERAMSRRWFGILGSRTREQAIDYLENDHWNEYNLVVLRRSRDYECVRGLLSIASIKAPDQDIFLTSEDCLILDEYFAQS